MNRLYVQCTMNGTCYVELSDEESGVVGTLDFSPDNVASLSFTSFGNDLLVISNNRKNDG